MLQKLLSLFFMLGGLCIVFIGIYYPVRQKKTHANNKKSLKYEMALDISVGLIYFALGFLYFLDILSRILFNTVAIGTAIIVRFIPRVINKISKYNK